MRPVPNVMTLSERHAAAGKATTLVAMLKRAPQRGRNRPCSCSNLGDSSISAMAHHHAAGVARQPLGRSRRNARAAFEHRLARRIGMNDDLIALARRAGLHATV